jgi:hypothetical protein
MPIQGFNESLRPDRLGKIRLGMKVPSEKDPSKTYPRATPYFVVPPEVAEVHGDKPTEIYPIWVSSDNLDDFVSHHYEYWTQTNALVCRGDGVKAMAKLDTETGAFAERGTANWTRKEMSCEGEECPYYKQKKCRAMMHFDFLLPEVPGIGMWTLSTTSWNGARNILSSLKALQNMCRMLKDAHMPGIPLTLALVPQDATPPGGPKKKIYVVHLRIPLKFADVARLAQTPIGAQFRIAAGPISIEEAEKEGIPDDLVGPFEGDEPETKATETAPQAMSTPAEPTVAPAATETATGTVTAPVEQPADGKRPPGKSAGKTKADSVAKVKSDAPNAKPAAETQAEVNARTAQENAQMALNAPVTPGADGSLPPPAQPAKIDVMGLAKDLLGEDGVRVFLMPEMVRLYGTTMRFSDLSVQQTETLAVAVQQEKAKRDAALSADQVAKHLSLRKVLVKVLMRERGMPKEGAQQWLRDTLHVENTETLTIEELEAAIVKAREIPDSPVSDDDAPF